MARFKRSFEKNKVIAVRFYEKQLKRIDKCRRKKNQKRCEFIREGALLLCDVVEGKKIIDVSIVEAVAEMFNVKKEAEHGGE